MKNGSNKRKPTGSPEHSISGLWYVPVSAAIVLTLRIAAVFLPDNRLWGIDAFVYLDVLTAAFLTLPVLAFLIPFPGGPPDRLHGVFSGVHSVLVYWIIAASFLVAMLLFPMQTFFYGDGSIIIPEIYKLGQSPSYTSEILTNLKSAPLSGAAIVLIANTTPHVLHAFGLPIPESSMFPFIILSVLCFALLAVTIYFLVEKHERSIILLLLLGNAGTLLFFGYAEFYLPVYVLITVYLLSALRALDGGPVWVPVLAFFAACGAHYYTIALLPSLGYLLLAKTRHMPGYLRSAKNVLLCCLAALVLGVAGYFVSGLWNQGGRIVIPAVAISSPAGIQAYTLLSAEHLLDLVNVLILSAPVAVVYLLTLIVRKRKKSELDSPPFIFLVLALVSFSVFLIFANAAFGWARDWDLSAPLGVVLTLLAYLSAGKVSRPRTDRTALALVSFVFVVPWLTVNISPDSSVRRFEDIVELDAEKMYADYALSGFEALRKHYLHGRDYENELRMEKRMVERLGYPEHYRLLLNTVLVIAKKQPERFIDESGWMLDRLQNDASRLADAKRDRDYSISRHQVDSLAAAIAYQAYFRQAHGALREKLLALESGYNLRTAVRVIDGMDHFARGTYGAVEESLAGAAAAGFTTGKLAALRASALLMSGREDEAKVVYNEAVQRFPGDAELRFLMGYGFLVKGRRQEGRALLQESLRLSPTQDIRSEITDLLGRTE